HGGVYLAAIGGAAALTAARHIRSIETIAFPDLGMEAVRLMELDSLPVLVAIDSQGNDIYDR
ncbi:MAG: fumarate hydratase C-terminal domain-containing protein, partial [Rectinema sp.]|nr:fumarate hydratase C-terminal domain-containing protein [Rectinema sp.]